MPGQVNIEAHLCELLSKGFKAVFVLFAGFVVLVLFAAVYRVVRKGNYVVVFAYVLRGG